MYTTIDLKDLQYEYGLRAEDYKRVENIDELIQDIALGIIEVTDLIIDKSIKVEHFQELLEVMESGNIRYIEDMKTNRNEEKGVVKEKPSIEVAVNGKEKLECKLEETKIKEGSGKNLEVLDNNLEKDSNKEVIKDVNNTIIEDQLKEKELDNSSEIKIDEVEELDNEIVQGKVKEHTGLFGKIFKRRNKDLAQVEIDLGTGLEDVLKVDYTRGKYFKQMIVDKGYLTEEEVKQVEDTIQDHKRLGNTKYFIQTCRENGLLSEERCAKLLAIGTTKEILRKDILETQLDKIAEYNKELYIITNKYFIIDVDPVERVVVICKDLIDEPNVYYLEKLYPGYEVITKNVIEGVTKEMHSLISVKQVG